jgi:excisionase family DNA binding protein
MAATNQQILMTSITPEDLAELIESRIRKVIAEQPLFPKVTAPAPDEVMNTKQAASFLSLSEPTIYTLASKRAIPCMKKGKRLYFSRAALVEWLKEGQRLNPLQQEELTDTYLQQQKKRGRK